jgi:D-alanyl-D-alanine endopeptidase (penicillin-binding protein 7)
VLSALTAPPRLSARVAVVMDLDTDVVLFQRHAEQVHAIASISKLMALRVVVRRGLDWKGSTTIIKDDVVQTRGGARSRLIIGRSYRNADLVRAALLGSDNRSVLALGRSVGLGADVFAAAMTIEAKGLGLEHTVFADPTGINHGNRSTGLEVAKILRAVLAMPELASITRLKKWKTAAKERSGIPLIYRNTNALVHKEDREVLAGKTGFNSAAGWCVASAIQLPSGRRVAVVVLGTPTKYTRFRDSFRLEQWVVKQPWSRPEPVAPPMPKSSAATP